MTILAALGDTPPLPVLLSAVSALRNGQVIGIPTDTVYGLAVDPFVPGATARLFEAKRRPRDVVLPVLVADPDQARTLARDVPPVAIGLMERYWPGALTIVLGRRPGLDADLGEQNLTVGVRCPAHPVARSLCAQVGPLATTSANLHGQPTPETADGVAAVFGGAVTLVLDGGKCTGLPSTVVDCTAADVRLIREGRIPWSEVLAGLPAHERAAWTSGG